MVRKFNCQTLPAELRSKQNAKWTVRGAVSELVDNGYGPKRGDASQVIISFDSKKHILEVLDNGRGMDHIGRLFQGGNTIGRAIGDIGEYGVGGSLALLWLASRVDIWTLRDRKLQSDTVIWKDWIAADSFDDLGVNDDWVAARHNNTPAELLAVKHGTLIRLHLMPKRKFDASKCRQDLAMTYSPGLRAGKSLVWRTMRDGQEQDRINLTDAFVAPSSQAETVEFSAIVVNDDGVELPFKGRAFYDERTTQADSRIQIGFGYRIIRSATECFRSLTDGDDKYSGVGVSGWLDLGDAWRDKLTTTKDDIDDAPLFDALMDHVYQQIKPLLKKSQTKMFELEFEELAIGLQDAFNRRGGNITVTREPAQVPALEPGDKIPGIVDNPRSNPPPSPPGSLEREAPPLLKLQLKGLPDHQMRGHLCRSERSGNTLKVFINEDHETIIAAMRAKPVNRLLLNMAVCSEIAGTVAEDEEFINRLFRPADAQNIIAIDDHRDRGRTLQRELIDRVRKPNYGDDEAS